MASSNGTRKYSIIEQPVATNGLLNTAASKSVSHYQQCSALKARLLRIRNFRPYFALSVPPGDRKSTDPVTELWDLFSLGISLCFLYNLLPAPATPVQISTKAEGFDPANKKLTQRAIALFAMKINGELPNCEPFTVTDLFSRESTNGLLKVIHNVVLIVERLPQEVFEEQAPSLPSFVSHPSTDSISSEASSVGAPSASQVTARNNIIREMVETERKYVQDLEVMQRYATEIFQSHIMSQDTIHFLFPGLNQLLNFQRNFLIRLETTAEMPWTEQRWGSQFVEKEQEFVVYEPYCANYTRAADICLENGQLMPELPAFLIKPIQRICKYPLLLEDLIKVSTAANYPHYDELKAGCAAAKRIAVTINEALRRAENEATVKGLESRIEDWKGHHLHNFGELLLDDVFVVTKSEVDREYHVFLFEKIILCCKEAIGPVPANGKKVSKNGSILKKSTPSPLLLTSANTPSKKKSTPLLLKGRIFLNNVTQAVPTSPRNSMASSLTNPYALQVWWRGDEELEFFTLRCRTDEQLKQWENQINRLIREAALRRASDTGASRLNAIQNSTNPRQTSMYNNQPATVREKSGYMGGNPAAQGRRNSPYGNDESSAMSPGYGAGPEGYPENDGFGFEAEDDFEDYPTTSNSYAPTSGRGTPLGPRRNTNPMGMAPERDNDRPRAQTEDTNGPVMAQWRSDRAMLPPPPPPPSNGLPSAPLPGMRPTTPRLTSNASFASAGVRAQQPQPPRGLRSQFSSTKLKSVYDNGGDVRSRAASPVVSLPPQPVMSRSRSASQPQAYIPKAAPPPLPTDSVWSRSNTSMGTNDKRGSGSSQSTDHSSDSSPNSSSPITPFGSSESSLGNVGLRSSRSQHFSGNGSSSMRNGVKMKVHFNEDIFVIETSRSTTFDDLMVMVGKKIRLCGPRGDDMPIRIKYRDDDDDLISVRSTEDVQMAFESIRPGGHVTLFVT